jgi:hypothetical protein
MIYTRRDIGAPAIIRLPAARLLRRAFMIAVMGELSFSDAANPESPGVNIFPKSM